MSDLKVFFPRILWQITLRAGSSNRNYGGQLHNVTEIVIHPQYNPSLFDNDVALIRVERPFAGPNVQSVLVIPARYEPATGLRTMVTGWGRTVSGLAIVGWT